MLYCKHLKSDFRPAVTEEQVAFAKFLCNSIRTGLCFYREVMFSHAMPKSTEWFPTKQS